MLIELTWEPGVSIIVKKLTVIKDKTTTHARSLLCLCENKPSFRNCTGTQGHSWMQTQISFGFIAQEQSGQHSRKVLKAHPCHLYVMSPTFTEWKKIIHKCAWTMEKMSVGEQVIPVSHPYPVLTVKLISNVLTITWLEPVSNISFYTGQGTTFIWDIC